MPMKKIYTLVFVSNNIKNEENFLLNLNEIAENEKKLRKALSHLVYSPRQKVLDNIFKFARESKI
jgi:hypothetical protein